MSKRNGTRNDLAIGIVSVFFGVVAFAFTQSIFNLFFVPILVGLLWSHAIKMNRLEQRLSQIEARLYVNQSNSRQETS